MVCFQLLPALRKVSGKRESFQALYSKATRMCETLHLTPIASPRVCIPGSAPAHVHASPTDYCWTEFYRVLDVVDMQFRERFEQEGMQMLRHLGQVLLTEEIHGVVQQYPEINPDQKSTQTSSKFSLHGAEWTTASSLVLTSLLFFKRWPQRSVVSLTESKQLPNSS